MTEYLVEAYDIMIEVIFENYKKDKFKLDVINNNIPLISSNEKHLEICTIGFLNRTNDITIINKLKKADIMMENILTIVCEPFTSLEKHFSIKYEKGIEMLFIHNFIKAKFIHLFKKHCKNPILLKYIDEKEQKYNVAIMILAAKKYNRSKHPLFEQPKKIVHKIVDIMFSCPLTEFDDDAERT